MANTAGPSPITGPKTTPSPNGPRTAPVPGFRQKPGAGADETPGSGSNGRTAPAHS
jgi:hypothetical protein